LFIHYYSLRSIFIRLQQQPKKKDFNSMEFHGIARPDFSPSYPAQPQKAFCKPRLDNVFSTCIKER
jgi:hypothetical protein